MLFILLLFVSVSFEFKVDHRYQLKEGRRDDFMYTGLLYSYTNKATGRVMPQAGSATMFPPPVDKNNKYHWDRQVGPADTLQYRGDEIIVYDGRRCFSKTSDGYYIWEDHHSDIDQLGICVDLNYGVLAWSRYNSADDDVSKWRVQVFDYKLFAKLDNFQLRESVEEMLKQKFKKVDLIEAHTIENPSSATITTEISQTKSKTETFEVSCSKGTSLVVGGFTKFKISSKLDVKIPLMASGGTKTSLEVGFDIKHENTQKDTRSFSTSKTVEYNIKKTITVPPYTSVSVSAYVNWIDNVEIPYTADLTVFGEGPIFENDGDLSPETLRLLLEREAFDFNLPEKSETSKSITFIQEGVMKASFGLKTFIKVREIEKVSVLSASQRVLRPKIDMEIELGEE